MIHCALDVINNVPNVKHDPYVSKDAPRLLTVWIHVILGRKRKCMRYSSEKHLDADEKLLQARSNVIHVVRSPILRPPHTRVGALAGGCLQMYVT